MNCVLVKNENGTFLVFANEDDASEAAKFTPQHFGISCFGGYYNAIKIA
jgi:hypothetical protein